MASKNTKATARAEREARAAAALKEAKKGERKRNIISAAVVLVLVALLVGGAFLLTRGADDPADVAAPEAGTSDFGLTIGDADAPHDIVIYEDFLCPFCGQLEEASGERLAELAEEGKVQVEYRPFNLLGRISDYSERATNAFHVVREAAGPEVAKTFHDELYADQPSEQGPFPDADWLVEKAVEAGATEADVRPGIEDMTSADWVQDATDAAEEAGVQGTPTILLDGEVFSDGSTPAELAENLIAAVE